MVTQSVKPGIVYIFLLFFLIKITHPFASVHKEIKDEFDIICALHDEWKTKWDGVQFGLRLEKKVEREELQKKEKEEKERKASSRSFVKGNLVSFLQKKNQPTVSDPPDELAAIAVE